MQSMLRNADAAPRARRVGVPLVKMAVTLGVRVAPTEPLNQHMPEDKPGRGLDSCNGTWPAAKFQELLRDVDAMTPSLPNGMANCDGRDEVRPSILFGVVSSAKRLGDARQLLLGNLRAIGEWGGVSATFVLYTFDSSCARWGPIGADARAAAGAALLSFSCEDAGNVTMSTTQRATYVPKSLLLVRLVQHLRGHQVVWTLDDDISRTSRSGRSGGSAAVWTPSSCSPSSPTADKPIGSPTAARGTTTCG